MWDAGLVDEVRALEALGLRSGKTASRALGYAQVLRMFDGELDEPGAITATQAATRRFVRRQRSWFRRDDRVRWLDPTGEAGAVSKVLKLIPHESHGLRPESRDNPRRI